MIQEQARAASQDEQEDCLLQFSRSPHTIVDHRAYQHNWILLIEQVMTQSLALQGDPATSDAAVDSLEAIWHVKT